MICSGLCNNHSTSWWLSHLPIWECFTSVDYQGKERKSSAKLVIIKLCKTLGNTRCVTVLLLHGEPSVTSQLNLCVIFSVVMLSLQPSICQQIPLQNWEHPFFHVLSYYFLYSERESAIRQARNNLFVYFCSAGTSLLEFFGILGIYKGVRTRENSMVIPKCSLTCWWLLWRSCFKMKPKMRSQQVFQALST